MGVWQAVTKKSWRIRAGLGGPCAPEADGCTYLVLTAQSTL